MKKNRLHLSIIIMLVSYVAIYGYYLALSVGLPDKTIYLQMRRYIPCSIAIGFSIYCWLTTQLPVYKLLPHLIVSWLWILVYPLLYWLTFHSNTTFIDNHFDIAFGAYVFAATVCLRLLLLAYCKNSIQRYSDAFLLGLIHTLLLLIPVTQIIYYQYYQSPFNEAAAMAILQTNPAEAREFVLLNFGYTGILIFVLFWLVIFLIFSRLNTLTPSAKIFTPKLTVAILFVCLITGWYSHKIFIETGVMWAYGNAKDYFLTSEKFKNNHETNFTNLQVTNPAKTFAKPSTIIMVIGESATRYYMSAYGYKERDTTPWMREMSTQPDFILFKHAYTSLGQTVPALERALTEKNQYNSIEFNQSLTIIDLAKKAGYTTYWFSNQGTISNADTPITLVAKTADHSAWIEDTLANTKTMKYDGDLLKYFKQVDPAKNNFIILHIMGSHDNYINRYPPEFTKWGTPNVYEPIIDYDNSLAYTDQFLKDVYTYGKQNLNLQALLYFSDHGADPRYMRHPDMTSFIGLRIPLFLFLSDEYRMLYPNTTTALVNHTDTYFTNDLIYEMIAGILNIKSNHYDETNSLASPQYKYTRETLTTRLGDWKLTKDTTEPEEQK